MAEAYQIIRSDRRTVAIQILADGTVLVRAPRRMPEAEIRRIVTRKSAWIAAHRNCVRPAPKLLTPTQMTQLKRQAQAVIPQKVEATAKKLGVTYGRISLRWQRTRWGSCSGKGNLNFNCLLMLAPARVLEYVVIHELCHRRHMNHSAAFWAEVERACPDYLTQRKWLKNEGRELIRRLPE